MQLYVHGAIMSMLKKHVHENHPKDSSKSDTPSMKTNLLAVDTLITSTNNPFWKLRL